MVNFNLCYCLFGYVFIYIYRFFRVSKEKNFIFFIRYDFGNCFIRLEVIFVESSGIYRIEIKKRMLIIIKYWVLMYIKIFFF